MVLWYKRDARTAELFFLSEAARHAHREIGKILRNRSTSRGWAIKPKSQEDTENGFRNTGARVQCRFRVLMGSRGHDNRRGLKSVTEVQPKCTKVYRGPVISRGTSGKAVRILIGSHYFRLPKHFTPTRNISINLITPCMYTGPKLLHCSILSPTGFSHIMLCLQLCLLDQTSKVKSSWSREATLALLALYAERKQKFDGPRYKNKVLWAEISTLLKEKGYMYDTEQAEGRWKTLLAAYRRTNDHNNKSGNDRKDMPFFQEVEDIVGDNPTVSPFAVISSSHGLTHRQKQTATKRKLKGSFQTADKGEDDDKASSDGSASTASTVKKQPCPNKKVKKEEELVNVLVKAQAERMKLAEKVHGDHMVVLNGVLDVLKQVVSRNQPY